MAPPPVARHYITELLHEWRAGDRRALDELVATVQADLRRLARIQMRGERASCTLQPTALVNELYVRLAQVRTIEWRDRVHFLSFASRLMRRVLVDAARARGAGKRGGSRVHVTLDEARAVDNRASDAPDVLALDQALERLAVIDPRKARVVELRFFGGLTIEEVAGTIGVSVETIARDWRTARMWLRREISGGTAP